MNARLAILEGTGKASTLLESLGTPGARTSLDVVGVARRLDIPLMFKRLDPLLGATVTVDGEAAGILVTTRRDLHVQRFTLAHEIGHVVMGHRMSFDDVIDQQGQFVSASRPVAEIAADAFASELLAPKSRILLAAKRHGWTKMRLREPAVIYQLSLRLGVSYTATVWALAGHNLFDRDFAIALSAVVPKTLKLALLAGRCALTNPWANVWEFGDRDDGTEIEASPDDLFVVRLRDNASAGYLWTPSDLGGQLVTISEIADLPDGYGVASERSVILRIAEPGYHQLAFIHRRPWSNETAGKIDIKVSNYGKEEPGLCRAERAELLASAVA